MVMRDAALLILLLVLLLGLGVLELAVHRARLARIAIRIHVNGTRGKSSATRLIAAALREAGRITCAKTTGTLPRMLLPDGRELPVFRPGRPNVIEQVRIVAAAVSVNAEALVLECMALQPALQWLSEHQLVRATHAVITNVRPDHLDVMGPGEIDVAKALCSTIPVDGVVYTAERVHLEVIRQACEDRGARLVALGDDELAAVSEAELSRFQYTEHRDNVALVLRLCGDLGITRATALEGMRKARPDFGAMTEHEIDFFGRRLVFVNGFAANDPVSTEFVWNKAVDRHRDCASRIAIFNCRADRPERSIQLGQACVTWQPADHLVLIGSGTYLFARAAVSAGLDASRLLFMEDRPSDEIFERVVSVAGASALVMGLGNIGGVGVPLVTYFANRGRLAAVAAAR